jgi:hypothetical protein
MKNMKDRLILLALWIVVAFITFFAMGKDSAPDWAKELEVLLGLGVSLILLNQAFDK